MKYQNYLFPLRFTAVLLTGILVMSCDTTNHIPDEAALPELEDKVARLENLPPDSGDYASANPQNADVQSHHRCASFRRHPGGDQYQIWTGTRTNLMGFPRTRWRGGRLYQPYRVPVIWGILKPGHYKPGQQIWIERMIKNRPSTKEHCTWQWETLGSTAYKYTYAIPVKENYLYQICVTEPHIPGKDYTCTGWRDVWTQADNKIPSVW